MLDVEHAGAITANTTDDAHPERTQDWLWRVEPRNGVVVAADDDDLETWMTSARVGHEVVELLLRERGRIRRIEDVASHEQGVDVVLDDPVDQPAQEQPMLELARVIVQRVAEVPVGGVDQALVTT